MLQDDPAKLRDGSWDVRVDTGFSCLEFNTLWLCVVLVQKTSIHTYFSTNLNFNFGSIFDCSFSTSEDVLQSSKLQHSFR